MPLGDGKLSLYISKRESNFSQRVYVCPHEGTSMNLVKRWKYAILASLVVAAVIVRSPDVKSMYIYAAPILALCVGVVWLVKRVNSAQ